ncbi:MAG: hypothetical protein WBB22_03325, partial [Anaerolineae bacterium]
SLSLSLRQTWPASMAVVAREGYDWSGRIATVPWVVAGQQERTTRAAMRTILHLIGTPSFVHAPSQFQAGDLRVVKYQGLSYSVTG